MSVPPNNIEQLVAWNRINQSAFGPTIVQTSIFEQITKNVEETERLCNRKIESAKSQESLEKSTAILEDLTDLKEAFEANELYNIFKASKEMLEEAKHA